MRLHLGCGRDLRSGYVNLDRALLPGVSLVADLEQGLPFRGDAFSEVLALHTLEHVDRFLPLLAELHRVSSADAIWRLAMPHFTASGAYTDPTHRRFFGYYSFDYFTGAGVYDFYAPTRLRLRHREIRWFWVKNERRVILSRALTWLINRFPRAYERFFCWLLPAASS